MAKFSHYKTKSLLIVVSLAMLTLHASVATAQRPRFPDFFQTQYTTPVQTPVFQNQTPILPGPISPGTTTAPPPASIVVPNFDPFQSTTQPLPFNTAPGFGAANTVPVLPPLQQEFTQPVFPQQFVQPNPSNSFFPRSWQSGQFFQQFRDEFLPRLLERPRFRYTFLPGDGKGNEFQINDIEIGTTLTFPRFLFVQQPIRISPVFIGHFWTGPETDGPGGTGFELPAKAFSAFLNLEHVSDPSLQAGLETNFTIGFYSDYDNLNSDSLRYTGVGLGWFRVNPTTVFKFGVEYFDRVDLKLLPAFGMFMRPTPDLQVDLYFPAPRVAQRLPNIGDREVWWYVAGEIGGGSWTVERDLPMIFDDQIDINDYRGIVGLEWIGPKGVNGFIETGYVFDRTLVSRVQFPAPSLKLRDTIMLRMGLAF